MLTNDGHAILPHPASKVRTRACCLACTWWLTRAVLPQSMIQLSRPQDEVGDGPTSVIILGEAPEARGSMPFGCPHPHCRTIAPLQPCLCLFDKPFV